MSGCPPPPPPPCSRPCAGSSKDKAGAVTVEAKAEAYRLQGNAALKRGDNTEAISCYTTAIVLTPRDHTIHSNRYVHDDVTTTWCAIVALAMR